MSFFTIMVSLVVLQLSWSYSDEYFPNSEIIESPYQEDFDEDPDLEIQRRNSNFLRFGRSGGKLHEQEYDDYGEGFPRPTRSGKAEKNDHFIRFGRSKQDFLRFGRNGKIGTSYLRFGRSRNKRDADSDFKRNDSNFLRFGRNNNFMRFGRVNGEMAVTRESTKSGDSLLLQLLTQLIANFRKEQMKNNAA